MKGFIHIEVAPVEGLDASTENEIGIGNRVTVKSHLERVSNLEKLSLVSEILDQLHFDKTEELMLLAFRHHLPPFDNLTETIIDLRAFGPAKGNHNREEEI